MNVGLVGCGRISLKHIRAIKENSLILYGTYDIIEDRMPEVFIPFRSYQHMIEHTHIDIVSICTPSDLHAEMAIAAAEAGKHVLVEKPIALKIEDAEDVIKACKFNNVKLCVVVQNRFNPHIGLIKTLNLGKVLVANATCRWHRPQSYFNGWMASWDRSGGVIINQLIHSLDMLLYLVGPVASVSAYADNLCRSLSFPDTYVANIKFWNGAIGSFEGTVCACPQNAENSITLVFEKGIVKIGGVALDQVSYVLSDLQKDSYVHRFDKVDIYGDSHVLQYAEFISAINEDREPTTNGFAALKALKFAYAIHDSVRENKEIHLE